MRTIVFFAILFACTALMGCGGDAGFLVKEGLVPAGEKTVEASGINSGAKATINQGNLVDILGKRRITFSGMEPKHAFIFIQFDNSPQERTVDEDGEIAFLVPKAAKFVTVTYVYGNHGLSRIYNLDPTKDYWWDSSTKTFNPVQP